MGQLCEWHAEYLKPLYPELYERLDNVKQILAVEQKKYRASKDKIAAAAIRAVKQDITSQQLVELYDTQGIPPSLIEQEAHKLGKHFHVPDNFYQLVAERHEQPEQVTATKKERVIGV